MMQNIMFLHPREGEPIDRLINLDHLATAWRHPEDGTTRLIVEGTHITMGMQFTDFLAKVQELIAENYRVSNENAARWHVKRMQDTEDVMSRVMKDAHQ